MQSQYERAVQPITKNLNQPLVDKTESNDIVISSIQQMATISEKEQKLLWNAELPSDMLVEEAGQANNDESDLQLYQSITALLTISESNKEFKAIKTQRDVKIRQEILDDIKNNYSYIFGGVSWFVVISVLSVFAIINHVDVANFFLNAIVIFATSFMFIQFLYSLSFLFVPDKFFEKKVNAKLMKQSIESKYRADLTLLWQFYDLNTILDLQQALESRNQPLIVTMINELAQYLQIGLQTNEINARLFDRYSSLSINGGFNPHNGLQRYDVFNALAILEKWGHLNSDEVVAWENKIHETFEHPITDRIRFASDLNEWSASIHKCQDILSYKPNLLPPKSIVLDINNKVFSNIRIWREHFKEWREEIIRHAIISNDTNQQ